MIGTLSSKYGACIRNFGQCYFEEDMKIYVIFIYKYWHYYLCQFYFEEDKNY